MFKTITNIFRIPELRNKILFTLALLCIYRIGFFIPLPGVNTHTLSGALNNSSSSPLGAISSYLSLFSGGYLGKSTIFGLGIMPYISAAIIFQLLGTVVPSLEKLQKEGEPGQRKINEWTRYATVALCVIQSGMWLTYLTRTSQTYPHGMLYKSMYNHHLFLFWIMGIAAMTAGSVFLMWLGEQIDEFGIGNGVSLIIMAGIVSLMPNAIMSVYRETSLRVTASPKYRYGIGTLLFLVAAFVFVVAGSIILTQATRRITIQHAKHIRGRRVYGGQSQYLPLRINHGGVIPIIFASSLMLFPTIILGYVSNWHWLAGLDVFRIFQSGMNPGAYLYEVVFVGMIFFFSYFWNTVQFQPKDMADQLRDYGSFIENIRPGKRTAEYLEAVMNRITYVGAAFLAVIAVVPTLVAFNMHISFLVTQFLGGTGLLIIIQVMLDVINRIEANLVMRDYDGLLDTHVTPRNKKRVRIAGPNQRPEPPPPKGRLGQRAKAPGNMA